MLPVKPASVPAEICPLCTGCGRPAAPGFFRCRSCGAVFNAEYRPLSYSDSYFTDEYRAQYGKTYFEDYPAISALADRRLDFIFKLMKKEGGAGVSDALLVDIGSAAGFFLQRAKERGVKHLKGIEISEFAATYSKDKFGLDVEIAPFDKAQLPSEADIISAWFFIEHLEEPRGAIQRVYASLKRGGIFAFSVPSVFGPLYIFKRDQWAETHPVDHRIDLSPRSAVKILKAAGFRKIYVKPCGIHPERIWKAGTLSYRLFSGLYRAFSGLTGFSDTIEVYAIK